MLAGGDWRPESPPPLKKKLAGVPSAKEEENVAMRHFVPLSATDSRLLLLGLVDARGGVGSGENEAKLANDS